MIEHLYRLYPQVSLLFIDDHSPDQTAPAIKEMQKKYSTLSLIERSGKFGLGTAYNTAFKTALKGNYQFIIQMDCDFSHNPSDVLKLREACEQADVALGSRYLSGGKTSSWPWYRKLLSRTGIVLIQLLTGLSLRDSTSGFKCFRRESLERLANVKFLSRGYIFQSEVNFRLHQTGAKFVEIPIHFEQRKSGESKMNFGIIAEAVWVLIRLRISGLTTPVKRSHH